MHISITRINLQRLIAFHVKAFLFSVSTSLN